jgi:uncharacterized protein (DUF362 family)
MKRPTVIIRGCPNYDADRIHSIVREGLEALDLRPRGRTLVKPNCVASGPHFPHAYTRPEFLEGVLRALRDRAADDLEEIALGERCGITVPTRHAFRYARYYPMLRRLGVKAYHFEETTQVEIPLYHPGRLRDSLFTPEPIAKADFFVNCPKFKAHPWTTVTFSMKNYIGIQDDRHRLIDHDHKLNEKVADLQYVIQPQFIAIDGIVAGEGRMLTPTPFDLKLIIMGDNQVAFDAVCCRIIGLEPLSVDHIRLAHERGFGPVELDGIDVRGEVTLEEAKARAKGFRTGLIRVEDYFAGTSVKAYSGPPPGGAGKDYCWGGCPGAIEEAIEILRQFDPGCDRKLLARPRLHVVFGAYDGEIDAEPGEKIVFLGDCARFHGAVAGKPVHVESVYVDRSQKSPHEAKGIDVFAKIASVSKKLKETKNDQVIRIAGCPVSVTEQVLLLAKLEGIRNPIFDPRESARFVSCYLSWKTRMAIQRILGVPYQTPGATERGASRPEQNLPAQGAPTPLEA